MVSQAIACDRPLKTYFNIIFFKNFLFFVYLFITFLVFYVPKTFIKGNCLFLNPIKLKASQEMRG